MKKNLLRAAMLTMAVAFAGAAATASAGRTYSDSAIAANAAHEIRMYPRYTIWDYVQLQVRDGNLELTGEVSQPFKKADLGRLMQHVPGVVSVTNRLEVLPTSPFDDRLRIQVARAIYGDPAFTRYALQAVPPVHIIVDNGRVTLEGVVGSEMDKNLAYQRASGAGLSFGPVINNLQVEKPARKG
jgi:hyperosmotically inducible protein